MFYKNGIEFATEEEAEEYYGEPSYGYYTESGFVQKRKENVNIIGEKYIDDYEEELKNWVVCAYVFGSYLYATNGRPSYNITLAKHMTESEANKKAINMNKKGTYHWSSQRVN